MLISNRTVSQSIIIYWIVQIRDLGEALEYASWDRSYQEGSTKERLNCTQS